MKTQGEKRDVQEGYLKLSSNYIKNYDVMYGD